MTLRVGILGTAHIASKNRRAIVVAGLRVSAIASRDLAKAAAWADDAVSCGDLPERPTPFGSYEELLASSDIDAVYVPLPCGLHLHWVLAAAEAGKHILVEKPAAASVAELEEMVSACRAARVVFLDGTMFHHHLRSAVMEKVFRDSAVFGQIGRVSSGFSFCGDNDFLTNNIRTSRALERFGALGDLGQYQIRFGLWVFGWELPATVRAVAHVVNKEGVPMDVTATFTYDDKRTILIDCAFTLAFRQWAEVVGTKSHLRLEDFTIPKSHNDGSFVVTRNPDLDASHSNCLGEEQRIDCPANQEALMWRAFAAKVQSGEGFCSEWAGWTLKVQACLDAAMLSITADGAPINVVRPESLSSK